jgi:hypothetical protein
LVVLLFLNISARIEQKNFLHITSSHYKSDITIKINHMSPRIQKELACAQNGSTEGINVSLPNPNNLHIWKALMKGPEGSPYEGGIF